MPHALKQMKRVKVPYDHEVSHDCCKVLLAWCVLEKLQPGRNIHCAKRRCAIDAS